MRAPPHRRLRAVVLMLFVLACHALMVFVAAVDLYKVLGVEREATAREIKQAYRRRALELHPDKLGSNATEADHERFIELARAYEVLSDDQSRAHYDQHGDSGGSGGGGPAFAPAKQYQHTHFDMFVAFPMGAFEFHWKQSTPPTPPAIGVEVVLTLEEVLRGTTRHVSVQRQRFCSACAGSGAESPHDTETCSVCDGTGRHMYLQADDAGYSHIVHTRCHVCEGTGRVVVKPCGVCNGTRYQQNTTTLEAVIPAGAPEGSQLPLHQEGHQQLHHKTGNVVLFIQHAPHKLFTRESNGVDLLYVLRIPLIDALLGFSTVVVEQASVPFSGFRQMFPAMGLPNHQDGARGALWVQVDVRFPRSFTNRQRALLQEVMGVAELAVLEDVIRLANAGLAESSARALTARDYALTRVCERDPFVCVRSPLLELLDAAAPRDTRGTRQGATGQ